MFWNAEDGYYVMGAGGYVVLIAALLIALVLIGVFRGKKKDAKSKFSVKTVTFAGVSIALAFVLSFVKLYHLPWGGSVTLLSMFFVVFVGYLYGPGVGFAAAFVYSILQFIQGGGGSYMLSPLQVMCDYFLAFTALGVSGFFKGKKNGLIIGYIIAVICRGAFHALGGYLFWMDYMPEDFFAPAVYPILYNYAYLIPEMILTVIVIILPPVRKAIERVRNMADQM